MKVIHVVLKLDCGGLEQLIIQLAQFHKNQGIESQIVSLELGGQLTAKAEDLGIKVFSLGKKQGFDLGLVFKLRELIVREKADVVHTHNLAPLVYGTLASVLAGIPCLTTRHGRADKRAKKWIWKLNKYIIAVSEDAKREMVKSNHLRSDDVKVIYNGIDLSKYHPVQDQTAIDRQKAELGINGAGFVIGQVARLSKEKDQDTLLKAFRNLMKKKFNAVLVLVGDGPLKETLKKTAQDLNISSHVKFLGYRDDIPQLLGTFDAFVLSSFMEGIPLTVLEAMASGKAVIATKVGGHPEIIEDGKTGILVPCGYPERIETAILRLEANKSLAHDLGLEARKTVEQKFSLTSMADQYKSLYEMMFKKGT